MTPLSSVGIATDYREISVYAMSLLREQYLKDAPALDSFLLKVALKEAAIQTGGSQSQTIKGDTLEELARKHQVAESVIARLLGTMDAEALRAMADGVSLNLDIMYLH